MEQRILQYRKQIDEWLTEMEQNVQTLSQHGEYSTQAVQRQTHTQKTDTEKTDIKKTDTEEQTMQEMVQDKLKEHLVQVGFFQHERLIHLIVTVTFALLEMLAIVLSVISDSLFNLLLPIVILILLIHISATIVPDIKDESFHSGFKKRFVGLYKFTVGSP